jgi:hypothetical protein
MASLRHRLADSAEQYVRADQYVASGICAAQSLNGGPEACAPTEKESIDA